MAQITSTRPTATRATASRSTATRHTATRGTTPNAAERVARAQQRLGELLNRYSIDALRVSLGLVFLGFGAQKLVPGLSPAQDLAVRTIETLTLGVVSGTAALVLTAVTECFIGLTLVTGRLVRAGLVVLGGALVGIMSPLVLFSGELFTPGPTLTAQYVAKDVVLAAAGLVVAARALGGQLRSDG